jgi:hypothetical protein
MNKDGLFLQYGTEKTVPTTGGDFRSPGETRTMEVQIDLADLTTSAVIVDNANTTFFPKGMLIEQVEVVSDTAAVGGTSVSVGLVNLDRTTALSTTAFVSALPIANINVDGEKNVLTAGVTSAGAYVGTTSAAPGYITALAAGTFTAGKITVRIKYRGLTPITQ